MFFNTAALVAASLALTANAHLFISSPQPIAGSAPKDPLDASGSNFPCHGVSLPSSGGEKMAAGSAQLLAFDTGNGANTAVHGGGSCQISITYETDATKVKDPKNWFVIYSIEGGCPTNSFANLDGSYTGPEGTYTGALDCTDPKTNGIDCVNQFNFTIPKGVRSGHAIMAWTWFNNVGNRELYMNCVNTQLTGGDGSEMSEFPSMFVANMASIDQCPTTESVAVKFPFAGKYVTTKQAPGPNTETVYPLAVPTGAGCAQDGAVIGGSPAPYSSPAPGGSSAPAAPSAQPSATGSHGGGIVTVTTLHTVTGGAAPSSAAPSMPAGGSSVPAGGSSVPAGGSSAPAMSSAPASSAPMAGSSAAPSSPPTASGAPSTGGSCSDGQVSCPNPGAVVCIGSSQFGICDIDNCAVPQALAAGTHCSGGVVAKRSHIRRHVGAHKHLY